MTKIILAHELLEAGLSQTCVAERLGICRRTVIRWARAIQEHGDLEAFLEHYQQAKSGPRTKRKRDQVLKQRIWALREKYRRRCKRHCGQKLQYFLKQEYDLDVSVTTIYKVLAEKYQLRPASLRAWIAPRHERSLLAINALNGLPLSRICRMAAAPPSLRCSPKAIKQGSSGSPDSLSAAW